jgi:hypothetical protein
MRGSWISLGPRKRAQSPPAPVVHINVSGGHIRCGAEGAGVG